MIYLCECQSCGKRQDIYRSVEERDADLPVCHGKPMQRVICSHEVVPDIAPYKSMIDGRIITSRNKHRQHLKQHNCIEVGNEKMGPSINPTKTLSRDQRREDIRRTIAQLRSR